MNVDIRTWFPSVWGGAAAKEVVDQYSQLARLKHVLADIALRGHVYVAAPAARDLYEAGINEGKRRMALDILNTCHAPHDVLRAVIDQAQRALAATNANRRPA